MTDRELLELAAKAAGLDYCHEDGEIRYGDAAMKWNPLANDGAALRLAVKLQITIDQSWKTMVKVYWFARDGKFEGHVDCINGVRRDFATRLAIVRAAAEIGKAQ